RRPGLGRAGRDQDRPGPGGGGRTGGSGAGERFRTGGRQRGGVHGGRQGRGGRGTRVRGERRRAARAGGGVRVPAGAADPRVDGLRLPRRRFRAVRAFGRTRAAFGVRPHQGGGRGRGAGFRGFVVGGADRVAVRAP